MNSVDFDSFISRTVPISEYTAAEQAKELERFWSPWEAHVRSQRLLKIAEDIANSLLIKKEGLGDF